MATAVATAHAAVVKKPSIKKYKAPTPPRKTPDRDEAKTDSQNNLVDGEVNDNDAAASDCIQTNEETNKAPSNRGSPLAPRAAAAPRLNGHDGETGSVLTRAALFESAGAFQRDPTTLSIRERKALFERNKGAAIVPKAPFGQAPSARMLRAANKPETQKPVKPLTASAAVSLAKSPSKSSLVKSASRSSLAQSRESLKDEGGIKGKLQALLCKEQTISEAGIVERNRREREQELEMLQNRFHFKAKPPQDDPPSDSESDTPDQSERAPLVASTVSLHPARRLDAAPPSLRDKCKSETALHSPPARDERDDVVGCQPAKRRSSQDSPAVLSVLEDVKRVKTLEAAPERLYPRLSDVDAATSSEENCGSRCGHYALECVFFFLCI